MRNKTKKPEIELLAPAGNLEKLKTAVIYGADAVYFGGEMFSLRAGAGNLSVPEIREAMDFLHERGARGYMTINIYPHNQHLPQLREYIREIKDIPVDAFLVSDPGVMSILWEEIPGAEVHLSTQANTTNYMTAKFWVDQGVSRIVAAREMSLAEIKEMRENLPEDIEIESFVHGAMCISYSGRCLMSSFMAGRDANLGACTHPCRWKYHIVEEKRPGEYYPVEEDDHGTYIMNSRDLCMLDSIPQLAQAGVSSFKIEGRMKSSYYVATVVSAYRRALDAYLADPDNYRYDPEWFNELCKASHREFTHGFYFNRPGSNDQSYQSSEYIRDYSFVGVVTGYEEETGLTIIEQRNKFSVGDDIEIFGPGTPYFTQHVEEMYDEEGNAIDCAPHPQQIVKLRLDRPAGEDFILRMKK